MSLPPDRQYRLVVHTSDITREQLVRRPWDYNDGLSRDEQAGVGADSDGGPTRWAAIDADEHVDWGR
jgi:hypothetical protein